MENMDSQLPVYVKIEDYKDVLEILHLIKNKINEAKRVLERIYQIKNEEDTELDVWNSELEEVERKVDFVDKSLFEPPM